MGFCGGYEVDLEENKKYDKGNRDQLNEVAWAELMPRLFKYASYKTAYYRKLFGDLILDPEDITIESIAAAYGIGKGLTYRNFNNEKYSDIESYIRGIIDSQINHSLRSSYSSNYTQVSLDDPTGPVDINKLSMRILILEILKRYWRRMKN